MAETASRKSSFAVIALYAAVLATGLVPIVLWFLGQGLVESLGGMTFELRQCNNFKVTDVSATVRVVLPLDGNPIGAKRIVLQRSYTGSEATELTDDAKLLDALKSGNPFGNQFGDPNTPPPPELSNAPFHVFLDGLTDDQSKHKWAQIRVIATDSIRYRFTRQLDNMVLNGVGFSAGDRKLVCTATPTMPAPTSIAGPTTKQPGEVAVFYADIGRKGATTKKETAFNLVYEAPLSDTPVIVDPKVRNNG